MAAGSRSERICSSAALRCRPVRRAAADAHFSHLGRPMPQVAHGLAAALRADAFSSRVSQTPSEKTIPRRKRTAGWLGFSSSDLDNMRTLLIFKFAAMAPIGQLQLIVGPIGVFAAQSPVLFQRRSVAWRCGRFGESRPLAVALDEASAPSREARNRAANSRLPTGLVRARLDFPRPPPPAPCGPVRRPAFPRVRPRLLQRRRPGRPPTQPPRANAPPSARQTAREFFDRNQPTRTQTLDFPCVRCRATRLFGLWPAGFAPSRVPTEIRDRCSTASRAPQQLATPPNRRAAAL